MSCDCGDCDAGEMNAQYAHEADTEEGLRIFCVCGHSRSNHEYPRYISSEC